MISRIEIIVIRAIVGLFSDFMRSEFLVIRGLIDFFKIFVCMQEIMRLYCLRLNNWFLIEFFFICCACIFVGITWLYVAVIILFNWSHILTVSQKLLIILCFSFKSRPYQSLLLLFLLFKYISLLTRFVTIFLTFHWCWISWSMFRSLFIPIIWLFSLLSFWSCVLLSLFGILNLWCS